MNRYRSYAGEDDPPLEEGDKFFVGVNQFDIAENLAPGQVQAATNMDFTDATAKTRGGFICLPELGNKNSTVSWVSRVSAGDLSWQYIAYGNATFVVVANNGSVGTVMTSPDGITWTLRKAASNATWVAVTFGNGLFVSVAFNGAVMTSTDGITWILRTAASSNHWLDVTYGNGLYVAVSFTGSGNRVMTSPDGVTWTSRTSAADVGWSGVAYGNGVFVAVAVSVGSTSSVMTSPDGITWTLRTAASVNDWATIAYGAGLFVALPSGGILSDLMTSPDGITWTARTSATGASSLWNSVTYGNGLFVGVAAFGTTRVMTSTDGITWTARTAAAANQWRAVAYGGGVFAAVSDNGTGNRVMTFTSLFSVFACGTYSDPNSLMTPWITIVGQSQVGFFSFGQTSRYVSYPAGFVISLQSTIVQANNYLFIFPGIGQTPIRWDGNWANSFIAAPASTLGAGYQDIPQSNQATYYQNRLWVVNGKDTESASQNLDFQNFNILTAAFNLNVGTSDYLIASYPFGDNSLIVFKKNSVYLLQNVDGALTDVTSTEITRQLGITGINACVSVGPDVVFMTDRNITTVTLSIQNKLQGVKVPLSQNINPIIRRVNWAYSSKISMGYSNNLLFVALPLDNATVCSTIIVYNFITQQWYGEWNFSTSINMAVQGFVRANYLGQIRLHVVTEDGRIFVTDQGQNDISGTTVSEISTSLTTRAYRLDNNSHIPRRMYMDLGTNRPDFTGTAYAEGASEYSTILSGQTYSRANSWLFNDSAYDLTNANNDFNRAFRQDYSTGPNSVQCGTGFQPEMPQDYRFPIITRRKGRLSWFQVDNTTGFIRINGIGVEARPGDRSNFVQVG